MRRPQRTRVSGFWRYRRGGHLWRLA
jgi:hypothetical protein